MEERNSTRCDSACHIVNGFATAQELGLGAIVVSVDLLLSAIFCEPSFVVRVLNREEEGMIIRLGLLGMLLLASLVAEARAQENRQRAEERRVKTRKARTA